MYLKRIKDFSVQINEDNTATIFVYSTNNGSKFPVGTLSDIEDYSADTLHALAEEYVTKVRGYEIVQLESEPPKRHYNKRTPLFPATQDKVTLTPYKKPDKIVYTLYYIPAGEYIVKLTNKGFLTSNKQRPVYFTKHDVNKVNNIADFRVDKITLPSSAHKVYDKL